MNFNIKTERDLAFIVSSLILSQREQFQYQTIIDQVDKNFEIPEGVNKFQVIKKTLGDLCEDGLIEKYSTNYKVCK